MTQEPKIQYIADLEGQKLTKTVKVRFPLAIDSDGKWWTYGYHSAQEGDAESVILDMSSDSLDTPVWKWIEAEVEVPQRQTIEASITSAKAES